MKAISKMVLAAVGAVFLAGCGGGGGSSSGGTAATGGGGGQPSALAMRQRQYPAPTFNPAPQGAQQVAQNALQTSAMDATKVYAPETQTLRVGSLISGNHRLLLLSQLQGPETSLEFYDETESTSLVHFRQFVECSGGTCPANDQDWEDVLNRADGDPNEWPEEWSNSFIGSRFWIIDGEFERWSESPTLDGYQNVRAQYEAGIARAARAEGYTGTITHTPIGYEHYRISSSSNEIHTDALARVHRVITGPNIDRVIGSDSGYSYYAVYTSPDNARTSRDSFDAALFGKRDPTATDRLDHMDFGVWAVNDHDDDFVGALAFGVETSAAAIPTTGTATYNGLVAGLVGPRTGEAGAGLRGVSGDVSVVVDFASDASDAVTATFSSMHSSAAATAATPASTAWHNFGFAGTLNAGDRAQYTANTITVANPAATIAAGVDLLDNLATGQSVPTGSLQGRFYGPVTGGETGGRWTVGDNNTIAVGSFGAKRQ